MQKITGTKKLFAAILSTLVLVLTFSIVPANRILGSEQVTEQSEEKIDHLADTAVNQTSLLRYEQYIARYSNATRPLAMQLIEAESFTGTDGMQSNILDTFEDAANLVVLTEETGTIYWDVDVPEDGLYHIGLRYYPVEGNSSSIEREILIDGEAPFEEAKRLVFSRVWRNTLSEVKRDSRGNDLRPRQVESPEWQEAVLRDTEGYYKESFSFYLSKGKHIITLVSLREPMVIDYLKLFQEEEIPSYADLEHTYEEQGFKKTNDVFVKIQGESAMLKSSPSLYPLNDRSSPSTQPYHVSKIRMNTIGGVNWKIPGQWITWEFDIPEDGLYEFGVRYKQNLARGINVVRKFYIDDQIPFKEAETIPFQYDGAWQITQPGQQDNPYLYYLTKGKHRMKLEVTMGELSDIVRMIRSSIQELNALYLKIIMITGTVPDPFRDYQLEKQIPNIEKVFLEQSEMLDKAADRMDQMVGGASGSATILRTTAYQLNDLGHHPETITRRLKQFKDNVSSLGTWLLSVNEQPLEIDYMFFTSPNVKTPQVNSGLFGKLRHELLSFWYSFSEDFNSVGNGSVNSDAINVWIASGRDQAQLLQTMIDNYFTPTTGIEVDLQLVNPAVLLPATLAGKGPDVSISTGEVINFAMRNALQDLSELPGFEKVKQRFMESAFVGFTYRGGVYAIPETQSFPMLFYRKDILEQLKLSPPDTWKDLYHIIPELQKHNMEIGMESMLVFEMLLYQNGGKYYQRDGIATDLGSSIGVDAFRKWTELYTNYKLPLIFDFLNRFRTGEMPLGISDYTTYNFLTVFAPEIRGQWDFMPIPGMLDPDGIVHREALTTSVGAVMFEDAKNKKAAWAFIDWWTDAEAQATFGREMEAILGESGRYAAANVEALKKLPWAAEDYNSLLQQFQWVEGRPDVPGGYSLTRHVTNAFYEVYNNGSDPRETLENYVRTINEEITIKRKEFHLPTK